MTDKAETLRRAATLMRERAEDSLGESGIYPDTWWGQPASTWLAPGDDHGLPKGMSVADALHIASWHPDVAVAVADLLRMQADHAAGQGTGCGSCVDYALAVADAYLGEGVSS